LGGRDCAYWLILLLNDISLLRFKRFATLDVHDNHIRRKGIICSFIGSCSEVGVHARWNYDVCQVIGRHRPASKDAPQYEVKRDKTGHLAMHKEQASEKE